MELKSFPQIHSHHHNNKGQMAFEIQNQNLFLLCIVGCGFHSPMIHSKAIFPQWRIPHRTFQRHKKRVK
jgi:hypothetical protein